MLTVLYTYYTHTYAYMHIQTCIYILCTTCLNRNLCYKLTRKVSPPHFVTYTLPSHNPPNTQTIPTVSTTKDLWIVLNTRLSAEDNVVSAANKACRVLFYLKRSFAALTPSIFLLLYKTFIRPHLEYSIQATHPILCRDAEALEKVQKLALKFVKGLKVK